MNDFKWKHFQGEIILGCVRWYCKYGISYRDLEEMMAERGIDVDHTTLYRWVQQYAPEIEKRLRWYYKPSSGESWKADETYVKVKGQWKYLYRAITKTAKTLDFYLSHTRNAKGAKRFLGKILRRMKEYEKPATINTDQAPSYEQAIRELKEALLIDNQVHHRKVKYLNNRIRDIFCGITVGWVLVVPVCSFFCNRADGPTIEIRYDFSGIEIHFLLEYTLLS